MELNGARTARAAPPTGPPTHRPHPERGIGTEPRVYCCIGEYSTVPLKLNGAMMSIHFTAMLSVCLIPCVRSSFSWGRCFGLPPGTEYQLQSNYCPSIIAALSSSPLLFGCFWRFFCERFFFLAQKLAQPRIYGLPIRFGPNREGCCIVVRFFGYRLSCHVA